MRKASMLNGTEWTTDRAPRRRWYAVSGTSDGSVWIAGEGRLRRY